MYLSSEKDGAQCAMTDCFTNRARRLLQRSYVQRQSRGPTIRLGAHAVSASISCLIGLDRLQTPCIPGLGNGHGAESQALCFALNSLLGLIRTLSTSVGTEDKRILFCLRNGLPFVVPQNCRGSASQRLGESSKSACIGLAQLKRRLSFKCEVSYGVQPQGACDKSTPACLSGDGVELSRVWWVPGADELSSPSVKRIRSIYIVATPSSWSECMSWARRVPCLQCLRNWSHPQWKIQR